MRRIAVGLALAALPVCLLAAVRSAPPRVSYARDILPVFEKRCIGCHASMAPGGGYQMTTREMLLKGGRHGTAVVPGKGSKSSLVAYLTGEMQPRMPSGSPPLDKDTIALIERWIDEGARFDTARPAPGAKPAPALPTAVTAARRSAPVTALAFSPDGKTLAAAGYRRVLLLDGTTGGLRQTVPVGQDQVQALGWSADGKTLAIGGGTPGVGGEVVLWDAATGKTGRLGLKEHVDVVTALSWRPGTREIATGSLDKTVRVWDADTGRCLRTHKDHADAVLAVAYSPDGKLLATGGVDRSVKLLDTATGKIVAALSAHNEAVTHLGFSHDGGLLASASADKTALIWKVKIGEMQNPERTVHEGDTITACGFAAGGAGFATGAANHVVKIYSGDGGKHERTLTEPKDWIYCVAYSPDGKTLAAGGQNGAIFMWSAGDGKLLSQVSLPPVSAPAHSRKGSRK